MIERFAVAALRIAMSKSYGNLGSDGALAHAAIECGLLRELGHDGTGGVALGYTDAGLTMKKRVEQADAREKIAALKAEIAKLEVTANG